MDNNKYKTGMTPGKGKYKCTKCPYIIDLSDGEELPYCPWCGADEYIKLDK